MKIKVEGIFSATFLIFPGFFFQRYLKSVFESYHICHSTSVVIMFQMHTSNIQVAFKNTFVAVISRYYSKLNDLSRKL